MRTLTTYQDYLRQLATKPHSTALDYELFIEENDLKHKKLINSFCRLTSSVIFLLDYSTLRYPFMDSNAKAVLGHSYKAFLEGGVEFALHHCHYRDKQLYNKCIFPDRLSFLDAQSEKSLNNHRFTHTFRLRRDDGRYDHFLQQCTFISAPGVSGPVAVFGVVSNITDQGRTGTVAHLIEQADQNEKWNTLLSRLYYPDIEVEELLSKRELEILRWVREGYRSQQIADRLYISLHTVNTHRKNMLQKTNSQNVIELIHFAVSRGLL